MPEDEEEPWYIRAIDTCAEAAIQSAPAIAFGALPYLAGCKSSKDVDPISTPADLFDVPLTFSEKGTIAVLVAQVPYPEKGADLTNKSVLHEAAVYHNMAISYMRYIFSNNRASHVVVFNMTDGTVRHYMKAPSGQSENYSQKNQVSFDSVEIPNYRYRSGDKLTMTPIAGSKPRYYPGAIEILSSGAKPTDDIGYDEYEKFKETQLKEKGLSIAHVYSWLSQKWLRGRVAELHFFGHSWVGGPIIFNCEKWDSKKFDRDCRVGDFRNSRLSYIFPNQGPPAFREAFLKESTIAIWGCMDSVVESERHKKEMPIRDIINECVKMNIEDSEEEKYAIKKVDELLADNYPKSLASLMNRPVVAALPGYDSQRDSNEDAAVSPKAMHAGPHRVKVMEFYEKHFNFSFMVDGAFKHFYGDNGSLRSYGIEGKYGRGYAIYRP